MPINISGKHIEIGDSLKDHITTELRAVIEKYVGEILEAHVVVSKEAHIFNVDLSVHVSRNFVVKCHCDDIDAYRSATKAIEKLANRIKRYKARLKNRKRHPNNSEIFSASKYIVPKEQEDDHTNDTPLVIAEMNIEIPTLTVSEAVMRLDLSDNPVFIFCNNNNQQLNIVYRRQDGNIGWVNPNLTNG